jgi:hypothetical protein
LDYSRHGTRSRQNIAATSAIPNHRQRGPQQRLRRDLHSKKSEPKKDPGMNLSVRQTSDKQVRETLPSRSQRTDHDCMCRMNPRQTLAQLLGSFSVITFIARCLAADVGATRARYKFLRHEEDFSPVQPRRSICGTGSNTSRLESLNLCPSAGKSGNASRVTRTNSSARTPIADSAYLL